MLWFRNLKPEIIRVGTMTLNPREVFALAYNPSTSLFTLHNEKEDKTLISEKSTVDDLLANSRPHTTKPSMRNCTADKLIEEADANVPLSTQAGPKHNPFQVSTDVVRVSKGKPSIPKSFPITLALLDVPIKAADVSMQPISQDYKDYVDEAMSYLGTKHDPKTRRFVLCQSTSEPTCLLTRTFNQGKLKGTKSVYLILNWAQLNRLCPRGNVDIAFIAQVITHEYAHYKFNSGVLKQSDKIKFRQLLAARALHPDMFNHPGYNYPWYEEAWAVLCEYMVHGSSARGLTITDGWEIAAKYFDNNYLKGGKPSGDKLKSIRP